MKILLGVTGSIAAKLTSKLIAELKQAGHEVRLVGTEISKHFVNDQIDDAGDLEGVIIYFDADEWYHQKSYGKVLHIDLTKWADVFIIAPCTANTLTKIGLGLCDNLVTNCARAWPKDKKLIVALAANTEMIKHPMTAESCACMEVIFSNLAWVSPTTKTLYCGDTGIGAMANIEDIVTCVNQYLPETV